MKVFTIENGVVKTGAIAKNITLMDRYDGTETTFPAIIIGQEGIDCEQNFIPVTLSQRQRTEMIKYGYATILYAEPFLAYDYELRIKPQNKTNSKKALCVFTKNHGQPQGRFEGLYLPQGDQDYVEAVYRMFPGTTLIKGKGVSDKHYRDLRYSKGEHLFDHKPDIDPSVTMEVLLRREEAIAVLHRGNEFSVECYSTPDNRRRIADLPETDLRRFFNPIVDFAWDGFDLTSTPY